MTADATLDALLARIRQDFDVDFEPLAVDDNTLHVLTIRNMPQYIDRSRICPSGPRSGRALLYWVACCANTPRRAKVCWSWARAAAC